MDYAEMAKLAKRIEYLESKETVSGADSWLELEKRVTNLEMRARGYKLVEMKCGDRVVSTLWEPPEECPHCGRRY